MPDSEKLQNVFREAAGTLGERVLGGRQLVWKPGMFDEFKTQVGAGKTMVKMAIDANLRGTRSGIEGFDAASAPPPLARQNSAAPRSPAPDVRPRRTSFVPPPPGRSMPAARPPFQDGKMAAKRMGGLMATIALIEESVIGGGDMILDPSSLKVGSMAAGYQDAASPTIKECIKGFAEMIGDAGMFDQLTIDRGEEIASEIASCLPVIGAVMTLGTGAAQAVKLCIDRHKVWMLGRNEVHVTPGLPVHALQATRALYNRHSVEMATRAATNLTAGGLATAGLAVDMGGVSGPLLGIVRSTINLVITIVNTCMTLTEMRIGNDILRNNGPYDATLLTRCPILGTYVLTEAESSTLYAFLHANGRLKDNWMSEVERLMPTIRDVTLAANALQRRSPFELAQQGVTTFAKGDHFHNTAKYLAPARVAHEAGLVARRDPAALGFLLAHTRARR